MNEKNSVSTVGDVTSVVWNWRSGHEPARPPSSPLWLKVLIQALVPTVIGLILYFGFAFRIFPYILWSIAGIFVLIGLLAPKTFVSIERGMQRFGHWVGIGLSYGLLVPFYYLVFPVGHFFRWLSGKDTLHLKYPAHEPTYWMTRAPLKPEHFKKQY